MKLTYVTTYDSNDVSHWSGTGHFTANALKAQGCEVDMAGPLPAPPMQWPFAKAKGLLYNRLLRKRYHPGHDIHAARHYARRVREHLSRFGGSDAVFSPGVIPIAFLECDEPVAFWSDATHAALFNFYPEYSGLCRETERDGNAIEQAAIDRAAAAIFSSEWAAESAVRDYGADPKKVHVVPFGANLATPPSNSQTQAAIEGRETRKCRLLHIGVDWERKGGQLALQVASELNRIGLPTELRIVGCNPFPGTTTPWFVRCEGYLNKRKAEDRARLDQLLSESHFLIVPSMAECYGLVYCEASAFGVPSLARSVGGVPTIVRDHRNGHLFAPSTPAAAYVQFIESHFTHFDQYLELARTSREEFETRLNWDVAGKKVRGILEEIRPTSPSRNAARQSQTRTTESHNPVVTP